MRDKYDAHPILKSDITHLHFSEKAKNIIAQFELEDITLSPESLRDLKVNSLARLSI